MAIKTGPLKDPKTAKAVWDAMVAGKEIFWATYGTTTLAEVTAAYNAGKMVACFRGGTIYVLGNLQESYCYFYAAARATFLYLIVQGNAQWTAGQTTAEETTNRVNTISGNETATGKYPSTKAVADFAVQSLTASGKKIWAGTQAEFDLLTPSNDTIYFIIPAL